VTDPTECLVPLRETGTRQPLYCVHPVSGSPYVYARLGQLLAQRPVYGFEAPGFDNDREPAETLLAMAEEYVEALDAHRPDTPRLLLGWSMGGAIAYEMAQRIVAAGGRVPLLVLIDAAVPTGAELPAESWMRYRFLHDLLAISGLRDDGLAALLAELPDDADTEEVFARIERVGLLPEELDADFLSDRYAVFQAHIRALFPHRATPGYPGPVLLVKASESDQLYLNWRELAQDVTEYTIEGDHHAMWTEEGIGTLAEIVTRHLDLIDDPTRPVEPALEGRS
jgi:thioesterase domain-containing protein